MRARGYDVTAMPFRRGTDHDNDDPDIFAKWRNRDGSAINPVYLNGTSLQVKETLIKEVLSWGNGGRGMIGVIYIGGGGHIFNVENRNGKVRFIESQSGKPDKGLSWPAQVNWNSSANYVFRTDDKVPNEDIMRWVRQRTDDEVHAPSKSQLATEYKRRGWSSLDSEALAFKAGWYAVATGQTPDKYSYPGSTASQEAYQQGVDWARSFR